MSPFGRLLRLTAPFGWWVGLATLLGLVAMASAVALMATSAYLIAKAALATEVAELTLALAGVRLFAILRASSRYLERLTTHTATFRILAHVRAWFYEAIEPLAPARLSRYRSGDLLGRSVGDIETLENFYVRVLAPPLVAAFVVVFACALLGSLDSSLAPPLLAFLLLAGAGLPLAMRRLGRVPGTKLVAARGELTASLVDEFQGAADLLIFDRAAEHRGRLLARGRELDGLEQRMAVLGGAGNAAGALLAGLASPVRLVPGGGPGRFRQSGAGLTRCRAARRPGEFRGPAAATGGASAVGGGARRVPADIRTHRCPGRSPRTRAPG